MRIRLEDSHKAQTYIISIFPFLIFLFPFFMLFFILYIIKLKDRLASVLYTKWHRYCIAFYSATRRLIFVIFFFQLVSIFIYANISGKKTLEQSKKFHVNDVQVHKQEAALSKCGYLWVRKFSDSNQTRTFDLYSLL